MSFKATGMLQSGSLLLNINFQGILRYLLMLDLQSFKSEVRGKHSKGRELQNLAV